MLIDGKARRSFTAVRFQNAKIGLHVQHLPIGHLALKVQSFHVTIPHPRSVVGISYREIAKIVGRSHSCVQKIIGRFKSDGLIENKSGRGRKSNLSDVAKRKVLKDIKIDPKLSVVKLAAETSRIMGRSVSAETVRNVIRHAGYSSRVARKKPFISLQNQKKRLEFTKTHQLKTDNFWKKVIFSDESKFNIFGSDGRRTVLDPKNLHPTVKHGGGSVMVWGCMASNEEKDVGAENSKKRWQKSFKTVDEKNSNSMGLQRDPLS
ncbi:transposable element Tc1 transposase [Trichonephila clavipes]|nr:transposable element Tc1 transposase [Trichonephila clavipes]